MQRDRQFYGRYFAELFLYLYHYEVKRPWYGLLILENRHDDFGSDIPYQLLLDGQVRRLYLEDLLLLSDLSPNLVLLKLLVVEKSEAASLAQLVLSSAQTEEEFRRQLDLIEAILASKFPQLSTQEILEMLDLKTADITQTRFYQEIFEVGEQSGKRKGRQEGEAELVIRLLSRRCGALSPSLEAQVRSLSLEQLEALGEALLDFRDRADLEAWLA